MVSVVADNAEIAQCLGRLLTLSEAAGAEFSGDLVVKCIEGNLSIEAPQHIVGKTLMRLPAACLVPLELFRLGIRDDEFVISGYEPGLTDACIALMNEMLDLYNLTKKLAAYRQASAWSLAASHPELLPHLMRGRYSRGLFVLYQSLINSGDNNELDLQSFLNSRTFGYSDATQAPPLLVLMPILDTMNHDYRGSSYSLRDPSDRDPILTMKRCEPLPGRGDECFACYGAHDCFAIWTGYSFIDDTSRFIHSLSMTINLPGLRNILVTEVVKPRDLNALPLSMKDLQLYVPRILARGRNQISIAALTIPGPQAPRALRRTLRFLISEMNPGRSPPRDLVLEAERQIVTANTCYFQDLANCLRAISLKDPLQQPIRDNFIRVCDHQLGLLSDYADYARD